MKEVQKQPISHPTPGPPEVFLWGVRGYGGENKERECEFESKEKKTNFSMLLLPRQHETTSGGVGEEDERVGKTKDEEKQSLRNFKEGSKGEETERQKVVMGPPPPRKRKKETENKSKPKLLLERKLETNNDFNSLRMCPVEFQKLGATQALAEVSKHILPDKRNTLTVARALTKFREKEAKEKIQKLLFFLQENEYKESETPQLLLQTIWPNSGIHQRFVNLKLALKEGFLNQEILEWMMLESGYAIYPDSRINAKSVVIREFVTFLTDLSLEKPKKRWECIKSTQWGWNLPVWFSFTAVMEKWLNDNEERIL